jgi:hypothetical protein
MRIDIEENNLKQGILGLILALIEIIKDALKTQAMRRIEQGALSDEEIERLGSALVDLEEALNQIKAEQNLMAVVEQIISGLDDVINETVDIFNPARWLEEYGLKQ